MLRTRETSRQRICTVSTIKDSAENVRTFVEGNLKAGADHLFIFLEGAKDEVADAHRYLEDHSAVTVVRTGARYWNHRRPADLNKRQMANANLVNCALVLFPEVQWLFHIDGDERLDINREKILALPSDVTCVKLQTREAVSQLHGTGEIALFKELLDYDDLCLLTMLGVIEEPVNTQYFNGHTTGKPGMRPRLDHFLRIHRVIDARQQEVDAVMADDLHVLHYESFTGEEFVRKWKNHAAGKSRTRFSGDRGQLLAAISAVVSNPALTDQDRQELLTQVYRRKVEDDVPTLERLGFLVRPDPAHHSYVPLTFNADEALTLQQLIDRLRPTDKRYFAPEVAELDPHVLFARVRGELGPGDEALGTRLDAFLGTSPGGFRGDNHRC